MVRFRLENYEDLFRKLDSSVSSAGMGLFLLASGIITKNDAFVLVGAGLLLVGGFVKGAEYGQLVEVRQVDAELRALTTEVKESAVDVGEAINQ